VQRNATFVATSLGEPVADAAPSTRATRALWCSFGIGVLDCSQHIWLYAMPLGDGGESSIWKLDSTEARSP
jgi:hypothetical protein